jgi:hypothetical protein
MSWEEEYKAKLRDFMARKGTPAEINRDRDAGDYGRVSVYGWISMDYRHVYEGKRCSWVVPEGARLEEHTYSLFQDTFSGNADEVGIEVYPVHCACGEKTDVTLRYVGSLGDVMRDIAGIEYAAGIDL